MENFIIKSKVYIVPEKKGKTLYILMNVCIIVLVAIAFIDIIMSNFKFSNLATIFVSLIISFMLRKRYNVKPYYQFSIAKLSFEGSQITIDYDCGVMVGILINTIQSIEYSDKLECLRFVCNYTLRDSKSLSTKNDSEYLFYISESEYKEAIVSIEEYTNHKLVYVDRKN